MSDCGSTRTLSSTGEGDDFPLAAPTPEVIVIDGAVKFRDGKRWKQRFCVLSKLSPAADCLQLRIYRDEKEKARNGHTKASLSLQQFLAMESGFTLDKESHTLAIICQDLAVVLAFDQRERLLQWSIRIANNLGEGVQFLAQLSSVPPKSKLTPGPVRLHVTEKKFCLTTGLPPKLLAHWEIANLRRYGVVDGRLVFEGGSRCGKGEGLHALVPEPNQAASIQEALDSAAKGQFTRVPSKRYPGMADSPRKSLLSKFNETRTPAGQLHCSNTCVSYHQHQPALSPTPPERVSTDELHIHCPSMDTFSSRTDSVVDAMSHCHSASPMGQPPQASAMERCISCTSKLGQAGAAQASAGDLLKPSWTMDLSLNNGNEGGLCNADRISLSSHGSSGCEFYYDTPRGAMIRKTGTPPYFNCHAQMESPTRTRGGCRSPLPQCTHSCGGHHYYNVPEHGVEILKPNCKMQLPGPYENYDVPRGGTHIPSCCINGSCNSQKAYPGIEWSKKEAMDRHSIASSMHCSEGLNEWYDLPKKPIEGQRGRHGCHSCACPRPHFPQNHIPDPMENYDVPGCNQKIEVNCHWNEEQKIGVSVNGEGRMPLVAGSAPLKIPNSQVIYAQVDKSKKTPKNPKPESAPPPQPVYVNTDVQSHQGHGSKNNYVNLEFIASLDLYENAKGVQPLPPKTPKAIGVGPTPLQSVPTAPSEKPKESNEKRDGDDGPPLRRSSSVPCKGGHANRGSASSSDSGVSGDGGLFFEDGSSVNELRSLCLHESLPRKGTKTSPISTPKDTPNEEQKEQSEVTYTEIPENGPIEGINNGVQLPSSPRHYETIDEAEGGKGGVPPQTAQSLAASCAQGQKIQRLVSEVRSSRSTSSGASDMSDYIETLSSSSRSSDGPMHLSLHISANNGHLVPTETKAALKPRSGKEYSKIDRSLFND